MDSSWKRQVEAKTRVLIIYLSKLMNAIDYNVLYIGFGYLMANYWQTLGYPELNSKCESLFRFETIPNTIGLNRILN